MTLRLSFPHRGACFCALSAGFAKILASTCGLNSKLLSFTLPLGSPLSVDQQDGIRIGLDGGRTIHFRASGNAPELRCYAEAKSAQDAQDLVRWGLSAAAAAMAE